MLLGRRDEQARLDALLEHARSSVSASLAVRGEAGVGKSALLRYAVDRAEGMIVLSTTGIEAEAELPFSGLSDLLHPVLEYRHQLPEPQSAALAAALAIGPRTSPDPFAISAATLNLLLLASERTPLLVVIDDLQWLDSGSRDAVMFAARRFHADAMALLFAVRDTAYAIPAGVATLELRGLDQEAARQLIAQAGQRLTPSVADRIHAATGGNPMAILEIVRQLTPQQLNGTAPFEEPLKSSRQLQQAFAKRVARLPAATQTPILLVAASQSGAIDELRRACAQLGGSLAELNSVEDRGLITNDGLRLQFSHPLIRSAVYHGAPAAQRRAAHAALAQSINQPAGLLEKAWHLAAAAQGPDESVAAVLEEAGFEARRRSGYAAAMRAFERAARLSLDDEAKARRLYEAGSDAYVAGHAPHGIDLLDEALKLAQSISLRADILHSRARIEMWTRSPAAARRLLIEAADAIESSDPEKAALMLVDATTTATQEGDQDGRIEGLFDFALQVAERAYRLGQRAGGQAEAAAAGAYARCLVATGRDNQRTRELLIASVDAIDERQSISLAVQLINTAAVFLAFEEWDRMRTPLERLIQAARATSAPGALPYALGHLSELEFRTGRWKEGLAEASEAVSLASELGHKVSLVYALACLAWIEAARGMENECRAHLQQMGSVIPHARNVVALYSARIGGLLDLGAGRNEEAITKLRPLFEILPRAGINAPGLVQEGPDLIEAYVHTGRLDEAKAALDQFQRQADNFVGTWSVAAAARCRGLIDDDFEAAFSRSIELNDRAGMPFERARSELCYGERLRRARQRAEARIQLHRALETFGQLGAEPWAERARNELRASGETVQRKPAGTSELTLQELQVALRVAEGATNREAAAALFLSPKTVEAHLSRIYSKLGVRSRTELAHRLVAEHATADVPAAVH
jgi:DNA-binding CsgD family transcriptional regulator